MRLSNSLEYVFRPLEQGMKAEAIGAKAGSLPELLAMVDGSLKAGSAKALLRGDVVSPYRTAKSQGASISTCSSSPIGRGSVLNTDKCGFDSCLEHHFETSDRSLVERQPNSTRHNVGSNPTGRAIFCHVVFTIFVTPGKRSERCHISLVLPLALHFIRNSADVLRNAVHGQASPARVIPGEAKHGRAGILGTAYASSARRKPARMDRFVKWVV